MQKEEAKQLTYVLITPARDEAKFIRKTLDSVVSQTVKPLKWVIVSDGSTDGTDEIVKEYVAKHDWIELLRMPERKERHFGGKVRAFDAGQERVKHLSYDVIGNQDGDSSYDPDYIEYLLGKFAANPKLGVAGTNYIEDDWDHTLKHDYRFSNIQDVTGQCQLFRRECFEAFGGYKVSKHGGVDLTATIAGRMHGWETQVFTDKILFHHRQQGTAQFGKYTVEYSNGRKDHMFGSHPLWAVCRYAYRMTKKPYVLGGVLLFVGYFWAKLCRTKMVVTPEMVAFRRREQIQRLGRIFFKMITPEYTRDQRRESRIGKFFRGISPNYFTVPFYLPRICRLVVNWPQYMTSYFLRRRGAAEFRLRSGVRLVDKRGALAGTIAVVFIRREYGVPHRFKTIVEVGAHIGCFSVYAAKSSPDARIYGYEPERANFEQLKENLRINGLEDRVTVHHCAVAARSGRRDLAVGDSLLNSFHILPDHAGHQAVQCTTLQEILESHKLDSVDLLKVNCEGAEYEILENCPPEIFKRIANIRLEYHHLNEKGKDGETLAALLESRGYQIERFSVYRNGSGFIWATRESAVNLSRSKGVARLSQFVTRKLMLASVPESLAGLFGLL